MFSFSMVSLQTLSRTRGPKFSCQVWKSFSQAQALSVSLFSGFHLQSNGQTERLNQELEAALHCVAANNSAA